MTMRFVISTIGMRRDLIRLRDFSLRLKRKDICSSFIIKNKNAGLSSGTFISSLEKNYLPTLSKCSFLAISCSFVSTLSGSIIIASLGQAGIHCGSS